MKNIVPLETETKKNKKRGARQGERRMEAWCARYCPDNWAEVCLGAEQGHFALWCARMSEATIDLPPRLVYAELRALIAGVWRGLRDNEPAVRPLCQLYWDLEHPTAEPLLPMEPELSTQESQRRLAALDAGRIAFKRLLLAAFTGPLQPIGVRNLVIRWARIQYECIHQFQAPPTADPARAVRDAMGLSDHFAELMDEVLTQVDGVPPNAE
jgi:hypothetical protein